MILLTHFGLETPYGGIDLCQHWLMWWLVAWRHQAITWTNVDLSSAKCCGIHPRAISLELLKIKIWDISLKITLLKWFSHLLGANELMSKWKKCSCPLWSWFSATHDDVIKWKHFPRYWLFVRGIHRSPVNSPHKGQWRGAWVFSLISARINGCVNNGEAGDLRRNRAHCDVIVMIRPFIVDKWKYIFMFPQINPARKG